MNADLVSTPGPESQFDYHVTGWRIVAALVDFIPLIILFVVMAVIFGEVEADGLSYSVNLHGWPFLHFLALTLVYYVLSEGFIGTTAGKMLLGLKVVRLDGKPYGWKAVLIRNLLRAVDGQACYVVGIVTIGMTKRRQRLGDLAAHTQVVRVVLHPQAAPTDTQLPPSAPLAVPTDARWKMSLAPRLTVALLLFALISGLTIYLSPRTTVPKAATPKAIPSDEELGRLTTDALLAFDRAVQARDFIAFHASVAELWKRQITPEELAEAFGPFIDNQVSIAGVKDVAPVFDTPPEINKQGLLVVSGYVPTEPLLVRFTLTYTYEHPAWKLVGIQVNVQEGENRKTIADYTEAIRLDPKDATAYADRGHAHLKKGEFNKAIADYDRAIRLDPKLAQAYILRAGAYGRKGEYDLVITDCTEAIRLDPKLADAYLGRGVAYQCLGEYDKAIADVTAVIRLDPNKAAAYHIRGEVHHNKGEHDKAIADYTEAIRLDPKDVEAYHNRGSVYANKGEYDKGIADFTEAIRLKPELAEAYSNRGVAHAKKREFDQAIADFTEAIRLKPKDAIACYNRGRAYAANGEQAKAEADFAKAKELGYEPE